VTRTVKIDALPDSPFRNLERDALVCVDVVSATTTAVTAAASTRRVLVAGSVKEAYELADANPNSVLAADVTGPLPEGFEVRASAAELSESAGPDQTLVLYAPPGTQLLTNSASAPVVYVACLRNLTATVRALAAHHAHVSLLAAGSSGEHRCEDEMAVARIAAGLAKHGFQLEGLGTSEFVARWSEADISLIGWGKSADELRRGGRAEDLAFVLSRVDDLDRVCLYANGEVEEVEPLHLAERFAWMRHAASAPTVGVPRRRIAGPTSEI